MVAVVVVVVARFCLLTEEEKLEKRANLSLCTGILGIQTSLSCGVLAIRGHARHLVNCFSAFSDEDSLKGP